MSIEQTTAAASSGGLPPLLEHPPGDRIYLVTDFLHSPYTKRAYRLAFEQFQRDGAKTSDLQVLLDHKPKVLEQMIIGYVEGLRDKGRARQTIALHVAAILHFFENNDIALNKRKITRAIPRDESYQQDKPYDLNEITKIFNASPDLRTKVMVLLMTSTACRVGALPVLQVGHLSPMPEHNLYRIQVYANSRKDNYVTYCTPECKAIIDAYLNYRRRLGESITAQSPLIREIFSRDNPFTIKRPRRCTDRMIFLALEKALHKAGINQRLPTMAKGKRRTTMLSHGFRKFAITTMDRAGLKDTARRYLTGHAQVGQDARYVLLNDEDLLSEYVKAIPLLIIDPNQRLEHENQELRGERSQEIAQLRAEVRKYQKITLWNMKTIKQLGLSREEFGKIYLANKTEAEEDFETQTSSSENG